MLRLNRAGCHIGRRLIFADVTLDVRPGERIQLTGPNGAGKTSLLRNAGGTMAVTSGTVLIDGSPRGSARARKLIGSCVEPENGLYPRLSGHQNLLCAARLRGSRRGAEASVAAVEDELEMAGFAADRVAQYSAGMRARVAVARAFLGSPRLALLDEPTRTLDAAGRDLLWAALDRRPRGRLPAGFAPARRPGTVRSP